MEIMKIEMHVRGSFDSERYDLQGVYTDLPEVKETDLILFTVVCGSSVGEPKLFLQDYPVTLVRATGAGDEIRYISDESRHFINCFGVTSVAIAASSSEEMSRLVPVNVLARKINKEQAEKLLDYLSLKMEDVTKLCFSKTQVGSDSAFGGTDTLTKIDFSRKILESLFLNRHRFVSHPCKKSIETLKVTQYDDSAYITDKDISWLFQHLDQLYPAPADASKVSINNRHYSIDQIQRTVVEKDTNLFENQVINGFLMCMKSFLLSVPSYQKKYNLGSPDDEYVTFDSILKKIEAPLMERRYKEARALLHQCNELIVFFQKYLPSTQKGAVQPILTPHAKRYSHYERAFRLIDKWYRLGQPTWSGASYLFGLKSLDKLYEFFCLYKLTDALIALGYSITSSETREPDRAAGMKGRPSLDSEEKLTNYYRFEGGGSSLELYYEPSIWSYSSLSRKGELVDIYHSRASTHPYYTPDFVVRFKTLDGEYRSYIFDAKYSGEQQTKEKHLPSIMEKYYFKVKGLDKNGLIDSNAVNLVYALIPKTHTQEYGFYGAPVNIYDEMATAPFFGYLKLSTDEDRPIQKMLKKIIEISG